MKMLLERIENYQKDMESFLEKLVNIDSGKDCPDGIKEVAETIGEQLQGLGFAVEYISSPGLPTHVIAKRKGTLTNPKNIMIIGHMDTVFSRGTVAKRPFSIKEGKAYGPGVLDMKSGITISLFALKALQEEGWDAHNITVFFCGDEENGHPTTNAKELYLDYAKNMDAVFNMETGADSGTVVIGRRGCMYPVIQVEGVASHSGKDPEKGASAIRELAHKIGELYKMDNFEKGIAFNAGVISGGIVANGIAAYAECQADCRFNKNEDYQYILEFLDKVVKEVHVPGTKTTLLYDEKRTFMPMEITDGNLSLYEVVRTQGEKLGIDIKGIYVGAGSDSCWTTKAGAPTVCAMGARGELNHSENEYLSLYSLVERAQLLALTIQAV